jgi:drug/metabolite transporter (DMT)-like permease
MKLPNQESRLERKDLPYTIAMVVLDIAAPIFLMLGLKTTAAANASLLNNFEIVATAVIALLLFHERVSRRLWLAIILVTISCILLTVEDASCLKFSTGSLLVLSACVCWGLENNCTRCISDKDPMEIVTIKGFGSGFGALCIAWCVKESFPHWQYIPQIMLLGFVAYGMSIFFYTYAQRVIGAAKTSTYYAVAPFVGMLLSFVILGEKITLIFILALAVMLVGAYFATFDRK